MNGKHAEISGWLIERIIEETGLSSDEVKPELQFAAFGLDSSRVAILAGELEDRLGIRIAPAMFWDFPNVSELAAFLADELEKSAPSALRSA